LRYYIGLLFEDPVGGFGVSFPDLPGCLAIGATLEGTRKEAAESLALHLATLASFGSPVPLASSIESILADPENCVGFAVVISCLEVLTEDA
jgi:predicted RNase H-like HicB family nuclease